MKAQLERRNAAVSESFVTDQRDKEILKKMKTGHVEEPQLAFTSLEGGKTLATVTLPPSISPENPHYHLVINTVSGHYYEKSHIIPRHELREEMLSQRELGKQPSLQKDKIDGKNLDTTIGCGILDHHRAVLRQKDEQRDRAAEAKKQAERDSLDRQLKVRAAEKAAAEEVLAFISTGSSDWERLPCDKLKSAYKCMANKLLKDIPITSAGLKKADVVLAIKLHLETYYPPAENNIEPPLANVRPVVEAPQEVPEELVPLVQTGRSRRGIKRPAKFSD